MKPLRFIGAGFALLASALMTGPVTRASKRSSPRSERHRYSKLYKPNGKQECERRVRQMQHIDERRAAS